MPFKDEFFDFGLRMVEEVGAEYVANIIFAGSHKPEDVSIVQRAADLFKLGKKTEAYAVLKSRPGGWGLADEQMLYNDTLGLVYAEKISKAEGLVLARFLAGRTPWERKRIREGGSKEENPSIRRRNLIVIAQCENDEDRIAFITSSGLWDMNAAEQMITDADDWARARLDEVNASIAQKVARNSQPLTVFPTWQGWVYYAIRVGVLAVVVVGLVIFWNWAAAR